MTAQHSSLICTAACVLQQLLQWIPIIHTFLCTLMSPTSRSPVTKQLQLWKPGWFSPTNPCESLLWETPHANCRWKLRWKTPRHSLQDACADSSLLSQVHSRRGARTRTPHGKPLDGQQHRHRSLRQVAEFPTFPWRQSGALLYNPSSGIH